MVDSAASKRLIAWIMTGVAVWGTILAIGAWWKFGNHDPRRALVVAGCVAAFLAFWGSMLAVRTRRIRRR